MDGVPVPRPGIAATPRQGSPGTEITVGTNSFEEASVTTGSSSAEFGNAQSGVSSRSTPGPAAPTLPGTSPYETDEPMGAFHGVGFNRIEASFGGPIASNLTFFALRRVDGQKSIKAGFDSQNFPLFVQAGSTPRWRCRARWTIRTRGRDSRPIPSIVYNYAIYRGDCDEFANAGSASSDDYARSANNYGVDCQGVRVPAIRPAPPTRSLAS